MAKSAAYMRAYRARKKQQTTPDWPEAFSDGVDYQKSGDVDHWSRTVTSSLQNKWDQFAGPYQSGVTSQDERWMLKDYNNGSLYGYVRTTNAMAINAKLYDPNNAGLTDAQIFTRTDWRGRPRDLMTVQALDKAINGHTTQDNATYTRFCGPGAIKSTFGLSDSDMAALSGARSLDAAQLAKLNQAMAGHSSYSKAYTSTSANRSMNAFAKKYTFERKLYAPKGTNAYAVQANAQESEVIFGRGLKTTVMKVTVANDGHIVIHEMVNGYNK